eukprot:TRINITY_DN1336_c0_g1_i1.p1 TRINITY_DN1336_c0_g1~~TRINITY_DN1336_c0_g1_i1.p1  ORF type:complete len:188 (-),score=44.54 TRINITY_DN1336_c0_g1_i1:609-1124(-)
MENNIVLCLVICDISSGNCLFYKQWKPFPKQTAADFNSEGLANLALSYYKFSKELGESCDSFQILFESFETGSKLTRVTTGYSKQILPSSRIFSRERLRLFCLKGNSMLLALFHQTPADLTQRKSDELKQKLKKFAEESLSNFLTQDLKSTKLNENFNEVLQRLSSSHQLR